LHLKPEVWRIESLFFFLTNVDLFLTFIPIQASFRKRILLMLFVKVFTELVQRQCLRWSQNSFHSMLEANASNLAWESFSSLVYFGTYWVVSRQMGAEEIQWLSTKCDQSTVDPYWLKLFKHRKLPMWNCITNDKQLNLKLYVFHFAIIGTIWVWIK
jgi:hypothetical protein